MSALIDLTDLRTEDNNFIVLDTDSHKVKLLVGKSYDRPRRLRVYVGGEEPVDFTEAYDLQKANGYASRGVNPDEDKLFDRLNRRVTKNKRAVLNDARQGFLADILEDLSFTFSRKAGCSMCECSPGFVADRVLKVRIDGLSVPVADMWVESKG